MKDLKDLLFMLHQLTIGQKPNKKNIDTKSKSFKALMWKLFFFGGGGSNIIFNDCLEGK